MYARRLDPPERSFLLLGPRGTGKTTWLRERLGQVRWYHLLLDRELLRLVRDPQVFRQEIDALPAGSWVVVDEIQKLPALMNEIHDALATAPRRWRFALIGSSARRLRRDNVNLLAGRVVMRRMLPLTLAEIGSGPAIDDRRSSAIRHAADGAYRAPRCRSLQFRAGERSLHEAVGLEEETQHQRPVR